MNKIYLLLLLFIVSCSDEGRQGKIEKRIKDQRHEFDQVQKMVDELIWMKRIEDIAIMDKLELVGHHWVKRKTLVSDHCIQCTKSIHSELRLMPSFQKISLARRNTH